MCGWLVYGKSRDPDATPAVADVYGLYVDPTTWRRGTGTLDDRVSPDRSLLSAAMTGQGWFARALASLSRVRSRDHWELADVRDVSVGIGGYDDNRRLIVIELRHERKKR